jgi:hypothetical protein
MLTGIDVIGGPSHVKVDGLRVQHYTLGKVIRGAQDLLHLCTVINFFLRCEVPLQRFLFTHYFDHPTHYGHKASELNGESSVDPRLQLPLNEEIRIGKQNTSQHVVPEQHQYDEVYEAEKDGEGPKGRDIYRQVLATRLTY